jgi:hypothetical protein
MTKRHIGIVALLALAVAGITAASTKMTDVVLVNSSIANSSVNSTPVGASSPSTGRFTTAESTWVRANGATPSTYPAQGAYMTWNGPGPAGFGGSVFVNVKGLGAGGFEWYNGDGSSIGTLLGYLDSSGNYIVGGDLYAGGSGSATVHGSQFTGNAATSGTADHLSTSFTRVLVNQNLCTPPNSTDGGCTGSVTFTAFADSNYGALVQAKAATGAFVFTTITGKSSGSFTYANSCTFNCSSVGTVTADVWLYHP